MKHTLATIDEAMELLKAGKMIILMSSDDEENKGALVVAAEYAVPETIDFMSRYGFGFICLSMAGNLIDKLQLPLMTANNKVPCAPAPVSIQLAQNVFADNLSKGRAQTIKVAISPESGPADIISPGHIFLLRAKSKGVLEKAGQAEGSVDLVRLAGLIPAAVLCSIMNEESTPSRHDELSAVAKKYQIPMVNIKDLIQYRMRQEVLVHPEVSTRIPLHDKGDFNMTLFENDLDNAEHFALVKPTLIENQIPLVRIHSECITGDVFGSCKCDCGRQLNQSLSLIAAEGGVFIYLRQEGRGIGLANKLKAYALQEQGWDTVDANYQLGLPVDNRSYVIAYQILKYFGIKIIRLLTNNPSKISEIESFGIKVTERLSLEIEPTEQSHKYLKTKKEKMGHLLASTLLVNGKKTE
jgi:3,4-dihydroxy 2-butanone 4-phosphate synthase/GTP cyclohydrolase II